VGGGALSSASRAYSYEEARFCSAIFRVSPATQLRAGHLLVPLAALFARPTSDQGPALWRSLWRRFSLADGRAWLQRYATVVLRAQLTIFLAFGVALEAHQQNTFLDFDERGELTRLVYQELGGGVFWDRERLVFLPVDFSKEVYARDDVIEPFAKCLACVRHTLLRSHLTPLIQEVSSCFGLDVAVLRADVAELVQSVSREARQMEADRLPGPSFDAYRTAVVEGILGPGERKALLRMRLLQTKGELYVDAPAEL